MQNYKFQEVYHILEKINTKGTVTWIYTVMNHNIVFHYLENFVETRLNEIRFYEVCDLIRKFPFPGKHP